MQINSSWLPKLRQWGIDEAALLTDACTNLMVGAWVLADNIQRLGYNWKAIGAYNAKTEWKRVKYANAIYRRLETLKKGG